MKSIVNSIRPWIFPVFFPTLLFGVLAWIYLAPLGEKTITWEAGENSVLIGRPLPDSRTRECDDVRGACITAVDEPLYMSIIPPAGLWHEMRVEVSYDLNDQQKFELGLMQNFATQSFILRPLQVEALEGEVYNKTPRNGESTFSLENVQKENGAYKLILSLPGVENVTKKPFIHDAKITFVRNTSVVGEMKWFVKGLWARRR